MAEALGHSNEQNEQQYLTFNIDNEMYGVDILSVMEIKNWERPTPIPESPPCIKGVINIRGTMVPIIDMRERFGLDSCKFDQFTVIIVVQIGVEKDDVIGLVVDGVNDVRNIANDKHKQIPSNAAISEDTYIRYLVMDQEQTIVVLDPKEIVAEKEDLYKIRKIDLEAIKS